jgi:pyruvate-formate lyase-activating enzyme
VNDPKKLPFPGMTKTPSGLDMIGGADFVACVVATAGEPKIVARFTEETGVRLDRAFFRSPIEVMVDNAVGHDPRIEALAKFADWVVVNLWGEEDAE